MRSLKVNMLRTTEMCNKQNKCEDIPDERELAAPDTEIKIEYSRRGLKRKLNLEHQKDGMFYCE